MKIGLPGINLGSSLDALAYVLVFSLVLQLVLVLVELADWQLACEQLWDFLQSLLILRENSHRKAESHEVIAFVLMVKQFL